MLHEVTTAAIEVGSLLHEPDVVICLRGPKMHCAGVIVPASPWRPDGHEASQASDPVGFAHTPIEPLGHEVVCVRERAAPVLLHRCDTGSRTETSGRRGLHRGVPS